MKINQPGVQGFIEQLLLFFQPLLDLQPFLEKSKVCRSCNLEEKKNLRWLLPLQIFDTKNLEFSSLQEYFNWYLSPKESQVCTLCFDTQMQIFLNFKKIPNFLIIECVTDNELNLQRNFIFNQTLVNEDTESKFELVATINRPTENHFNCSIYQPKPLCRDALEGWMLHDGLKNNGMLLEVHDFNELWRQNPIIVFYKKL